MKTRRFFITLFTALAMVLSLSNTQAASAVESQEEGLAASTPPLLLDITAISLGPTYTCALSASGEVLCWGGNRLGQPGAGGIKDIQYAPKYVNELSDAIAIAAGDEHTCALTSMGVTKCWGYNRYGQLGNGTTANSLTPTDVIGLSSGVISISTGSQHSCALTTGGGVKCWGNNDWGQLGDGSYQYRTTPTDVIGLASGVIAISAGSGHTCALTTGGSVKCWGYNFKGQLGDGTTTIRWTPVDVSGLSSGIVAISGGYWHTCALTSIGTVKCWGFNQYGQLGDGTREQRLIPTEVTGLSSNIIAISSGHMHTCATTSEGTAKCWGLNRYGQLGDGSTIERWTPVGVSGLSSGVASISAGRWHTCALTLVGGVKCWGANQWGQLGDGTAIGHPTPGDVLILNQAAFLSIAKQDGYIWESTETSNMGLRVNSSGYLRVGDDNSDRQYRAILSFNTSSLPDTSVIISAMVRIKRANTMGDPWFGGPQKADIRKTFFGASAGLFPEDFQTVSSMNGVVVFSHIGFDVNHWIKSVAFPYINNKGLTQFRLRFMQDDNDNMSADYYEFFSGDAQTSLRPQLIIYYYIP